MSHPQFEFASLNRGSSAINDRGRTVATVSRFGDVDWLLQSPLQPGPRLRSVKKETHLAYTLGLKLMLVTPVPATNLKTLLHRVEADGTRVVLQAEGESADGRFRSETTAVLGVDAGASRYEWRLETVLICLAKEPVTLLGIEYNNVYPSLAGRCMLYAPQKQFACTLMVDRDGTAWKFPHQHQLHYGGKTGQLRFAEGSLAGFFDEPSGNPVVVVERASLDPDWGICDMYYDLHCSARPRGPILPGDRLVFAYRIQYLGRAESAKWLAQARPIPVDAADQAAHEMPRLELGQNSFTRGAHIDRPDEASGFRPRPPQLVWDKQTGHATNGSLRITNDVPQETVWTGQPPTLIPPEHRLNIRGRVKTQHVTGKGVFIRVRYHTWAFEPAPPHVEWIRTLESEPVTGSSAGWVAVTVPELRVPAKDFDYLIYLDMVLDGQGVGWLTDVDVDLKPAPDPTPSLEEGSARSKRQAAPRRRTATAGATL